MDFEKRGTRSSDQKRQRMFWAVYENNAILTKHYAGKLQLPCSGVDVLSKHGNVSHIDRQVLVPSRKIIDLPPLPPSLIRNMLSRDS